MRQNDSKYHELFIMLNDPHDYLTQDDKDTILAIIKELYHDHQALLKAKDDCGKYGISYKTVDEDSMHSDSSMQFFASKGKRDNVYDDWMCGRYWDKILDEELEYATPTPNIHEVVKVFKESGLTYLEQEPIKEKL